MQRFSQLKRSVAQVVNQVPLRAVLVIPFVLQLVGTVGLVGYFSFKNGEQAVNTLSTQVMDRTGKLVDQHLTNYVDLSYKLIQGHLRAYDQGILDLNNSQATERYFWNQIQLFDLGYTSFIRTDGRMTGAGYYKGRMVIDEVNRSANGELMIHSFDAGADGERGKLFDTQVFDPRQEASYKLATEAGQLMWSGVYNWADAPEVLAIAMVTPVYKRNTSQTLLGALTVELPLLNINDFLNTISPSPQGQVFILQRNGNLIATSASELPYRMVGQRAQRLKATDAKDPILRATSQYLMRAFGTLEKIQTKQNLSFDLKGKTQFVQIYPWRDPNGINWLVATVVPESDFMGEINANRRTTFLLCGLALLVSTGIGLLIARWIEQPILGLNRAAKAIAQGNWEQPLSLDRRDELGELARSFSHMSSQLQESFATLEQRVEQRTAELARAKDAAEAASTAKSAFLASMSHELRTPLNAVLGFAQLLGYGDNLNPEQKENIGLIQTAGEHLLSLINDVLDFSKIEAGRTTLNPVHFDLLNLLSDLNSIFVLRAQAKDLDLTFELEPNLPRYIYADQLKLRQILINLIGNAVKFTEEGSIRLHAQVLYLPAAPLVLGAIAASPIASPATNPATKAKTLENLGIPPKSSEISQISEISETSEMSDTSLHLTFTVSDTGTGIAPEDMPHLFEAFVQARQGRGTQEGTGLGLPISFKFAQVMGGTLEVSSILGRGSAFQVTLPVTQAIASSQPAKPSQQLVVGLEPEQSHYRILIVDDKAPNRLLLTKILAPLNLEVRTAEQGQMALQIWEDWNPHLIWMDMRMPVMDGYEATRQIKQTTRGQATVIIAVTASVYEEDKAIVLSAGCDDFVRKPFLRGTIYELMAKHLGLRYRYAVGDPVLTEASPPTSQAGPPERVSPEQSVQQLLQTMPPAWCEALNQAAIEADSEQVLALIAQVPLESALLAQPLNDWVKNYRFDKVLALTDFT
jgi:signal transduction histidine kinase/DNA-binding NarL/FixJ family response regulator